VHEERAVVLRSLATLSGYHYEVPIGDGVSPDVARYRASPSSLFVGDAKATETSGCIATSERLGNYARAAMTWWRHGTSLLFIVAHDDQQASRGWVELLVRTTGDRRLPPPSRSGTTLLDEGFALAYVFCEGGGPGQVSGR
jgi:hypothetical protein